MNLFKQKPEEDMIQNRHHALLEQSRASARSLSAKNLPREEADDLGSYLRGIRSSYQHLLSENTAHLISRGTRLADLTQTSFTEKTKRLNKNLEQLNERLRKFTIQKDELPHGDYKTTNNIGVYILIGLLALLESLFGLKSFELFNHGSNIFQLFTLAGLVSFFIFLPQAIVFLFRSTEESPYKIWIRLGVFIIIFSGFYIFGILRSAYLANIQDTTLANVKANSTLVIRPIFFAGVNLLFLVVTVYASMRLPDDTKKSSHAKAKELDLKISELETSIANTEDELNRLPDQQLSGEVRESQNIAKAKSIAARVNSMFHENCNLWMTENTIHRNGVRPSCFDQNIPDLKTNIS